MSVIVNLATVKEPATTWIGVQLLALTDERGYGRMEWDAFVQLTRCDSRSAARRHLTRLKTAGVLRYSTDGFVEWWIDAQPTARNAQPTARMGDDLIDDLILEKFRSITSRSINPAETEIIRDAGQLAGKLLSELDGRWRGIKAKGNVAKYMAGILATLRDSGEVVEDSAAARRRRYIPDHMADIIIG